MKSVTKFKHLTLVRTAMVDEIEMDISNGTLFISERLTDYGVTEYPALLRQAAIQHDENWLAQQLHTNPCFKSHEISRTKHGYTNKRIPHNAHITLAEGEFNRFYIRGLCIHAIAEGIESLTICRFKEVREPRYTSFAAIGSLVSPQDILFDLRLPYDHRHTVLAQPNSGLTLDFLAN